jgi:hypothetical protein
MSLFLRTTDKDGKAYGGFQWPREVGAVVTAPDWQATATCGQGLHGLLDGLGDASHLSFDADAIWWIVEADDAIDLDGKHKFASCRVVAFGPRHEVTPQLYALRPGPIHGLALTGGYGSTLAGGDESTLAGGDRSTLTGGDRSTLTGGYGSTLTGGYGSTLIFLRWIDGRRRVLTAYVGEDGIKPGVAYRASDDFKTVEEVK